MLHLGGIFSQGIFVNEALFLGHVLIVAAFSLAALRLGVRALAAFVALQAVLANLFVVKQMVLFGLEATCSDVFAIGSLFSLNLIQEFFGKDEAKRAVRGAFLCLLFFAVMAEIHLLYSPSGHDQTQGSFGTIFSSNLRIVASSIAVYFVVQQIDVKLFGWMRERSMGKLLPLRLGASLVISQGLDTVLFSFLGLYGIVASVFDVIVVSLAIKWIAIGCSAPFTAFANRIARQS
jgi:hypothetical protein